MKHIRRCALIVLLGLSLPTSVRAQAKSHAYVEVGAGATDVNGGGEWLVADSPIGVGAEVGAGWVFLASVNISFSRVRRQRTICLPPLDTWG